MSRVRSDRQLRQIEEFMAGLGIVEDWQPSQAVVPVRFCEMRIDLDTSRGDIGLQFLRGLEQLAIRLRDLRHKFDEACTTARFSGGFAGGQGEVDDDADVYDEDDD